MSQSAAPAKHVIVPRLIAGLPLLLLGAKHFVDPEHFRRILEVSGLPGPIDLTLIAAPAAEVLAGVLLLLGLFARVGGLLGIATMAPAILSTVKLMNLEAADKPFVPPLPVPIAVLLCSAYVLWRGAGAWSVDAARSKEGTP